MRKYKEFFIPDSKPRTEDDILYKQSIYCLKSICAEYDCNKCLFHYKNKNAFTEWYLDKNKRGKHE